MNNNERCGEAAELIIAHFKTPHALSDFLIESIFRIYQYDIRYALKSGYADTFYIIQCTILDKWVKHATEPDSKVIKALGKEIASFFFDGWAGSGLRNSVHHLFRATFFHTMEGTYSESYAEKISAGINVFFQISEIYLYWQVYKKEFEQSRS